MTPGPNPLVSGHPRRRPAPDTVVALIGVITGLVAAALGSAAVLGAIFVAFAWKLKTDYSIRRAKHLYLFSLLYLALLFAVMLADGVYRF